MPTVELERELLVLNLRSLDVTLGGSYAAYRNLVDVWESLEDDRSGEAGVEGGKRVACSAVYVSSATKKSGN